jgi:hypothetical protein
MNYEQHSIVRNLSLRMMDQKKPPSFRYYGAGCVQPYVISLPSKDGLLARDRYMV